MVGKWMFFGLFLTAVAIDCQAKEIWFEGVIVLKNNEVHVGQIAIHHEYNVVSLKEDDKQFTFSAYQVASFNIHDEELGIVRKFKSLPYEENDGRYVDTFFEVVINKEVTLLRKQSKYHASNYEIMEVGLHTNYSRFVTNYEYFFEYKGIITPSNRFKKEFKPVLDIMLKDKLDAFIKDNGLNMNRTYDQIIVVRFFNKLVETEGASFLTSN